MVIVLHREISHTSKSDSLNLFLLLLSFILFFLISTNAKKVTQELSHGYLSCEHIRTVYIHFTGKIKKTQT